jgi:rhodanese-related sulfurtransferase
LTRSSCGPHHTRESEPVGRFTALFVETQLEDHLVVYCQSGHRSNIAAETLADLGYRHVYNVTGSMNAWLAAGFPVESGR